MTTYAVTAARYDEDEKLVALQGQETHGSPAALPELSTDVRDFSVSEVLGLMEGGDSFQLFFRSPGTLAGSIVPDGNGSLIEDQCIPGRRIADLPTF